MRREIPTPCKGSKDSAFSTSKSRVPRKRSVRFCPIPFSYRNTIRAYQSLKEFATRRFPLSRSSASDLKRGGSQRGDTSRSGMRATPEVLKAIGPLTHQAWRKLTFLCIIQPLYIVAGTATGSDRNLIADSADPEQSPKGFGRASQAQDSRRLYVRGPEGITAKRKAGWQKKAPAKKHTRAAAKEPNRESAELSGACLIYPQLSRARV